MNDYPQNPRKATGPGGNGPAAFPRNQPPARVSKAAHT